MIFFLWISLKSYDSLREDGGCSSPHVRIWWTGMDICGSALVTLWWYMMRVCGLFLGNSTFRDYLKNRKLSETIGRLEKKIVLNTFLFKSSIIVGKQNAGSPHQRLGFRCPLHWLACSVYFLYGVQVTCCKRGEMMVHISCNRCLALGILKTWFVTFTLILRVLQFS